MSSSSSSSSSSTSSARSASSYYSKSKSSSSVRVPVPVGTRKFPDGFVGPADMPFCKVCYDAGLPVSDYTDHFVKDQPGTDGKVVCPTLLAQKCLTCGVAGHTSSYCSDQLHREHEHTVRDREEYEQSKKASGGWETVGAKGSSSSSVKSKPKPKPRIEDMDSNKPASASASATKFDKHGATSSPAPPVTKKYGWFGALAVEDSSDSEDDREVAQLPIGSVPKPVRKEAAIVTGPPPAVEPPKALTWAQRAAAAAQKPVSSSSSSSSYSALTPLADTRFHLHSLCDNIEQIKRASANHRGAAAAIASESSKKRKQNSAMVPA